MSDEPRHDDPRDDEPRDDEPRDDEPRDDEPRPTRGQRLLAAFAVIHPGPTVAVVSLSGALGAILLAQAGDPLDERWLLTVVAIAGSQVFTGTTNDLVDRDRDEDAGRRDKPLASGRLSLGTAAWIASIGLAVQLAASLQIGWLALALGITATASAAAYNLWLSRTPFSPLPYLVSFAILPLWVTAGIGLPLERVAAAAPLAAAFAAAAHLANTLRDFEPDARGGSRALAQVLGRRVTHRLVVGTALAVGGIIGLAMALGGAGLPSVALAVIGLAAVGQGALNERRLWAGMLLAAVCWTGAWALATG